MSRIRKSLSGEKGFTLVELLVVIGIIGILAMMLLPQFRGMRDRARIASCQSNLKNIGTTLEAFYADQETYPTGAAAAAQQTSFEAAFEDKDGATAGVQNPILDCPHDLSRYTYTGTQARGTNFDGFSVVCNFHNGTLSTTTLTVTENGVVRQ